MRLVGFVVIVKSGPLTSTLIECEIEPLVAVTVVLKVPSAEEMVSIDVAVVMVEDNVTLVGLGTAVPLPVGTVAEMPMAPEKPYDPVTVKVEVPCDPETIVNDDGAAAMA